MSEWKTAAEWADEKLNGAPHSYTGMVDYFKRENTRLLGSNKARRRKGRGGGWEYHLSCLPAAAQRDYQRRRAAEMRVDEVEKTLTDLQLRPDATPQTLDARRRQIMESRAAVILELERRAVHTGSFSKTVADFLAEAEAGLLEEPIASTVKRAMEKGRGLTPSRPTLYNWRKALKDAGGDAKALVPKKRTQETKANIDDLYPWFTLFLRHYALPQGPTIQKAIDNTIEAMTDEQRLAWSGDCASKTPCRLPNYPKARRALRSLAETSDYLRAFKCREGPLALKARMSFKRRTFEDMDPTVVYTADGKTFDAEVAHPIHGKPFRPEITTVLDAVTRKCVGVSLGLAENAQEVADALRRACIGHGIPAIFYTDRGPGYKNDRIDDHSYGLCARLGITSTNSIAYNSQARGIIERANATLWNTLAKDFPTYIGPDMDREAKQKVHKQTRADIKQLGHSPLLPSWEDFTAAVAATIERYNDTPHSSLRIRDEITGRMRKATPNEVWADFEARGFEPISVSADEADDLFRPYEERTCRRGEVTIFNNQYSAPELEPYDSLKVLVGYDPFDPSKVWVRAIDTLEGQTVPGPLICVASFWHNKERYYPVSATNAALERRNKAALKRQDEKRNRTLEELRPNFTIDHQPSPPIPFPTDPKPEPAPEPMAMTEDNTEQRILTFPETAPIQPKKYVPADEYELADHCIAHPDTMTVNQRRLLVRLFNSPSMRELYELKGGKLNDLRNLLNSTASSASETSRQGQST